MPNIYILSRIEVERVSVDLLHLNTNSTTAVTIESGFIHWRLLLSRVGIVYFMRKLKTIQTNVSDLDLKRPTLITIWVDRVYAGHALLFFPNRQRIPNLFGQRVQEITYSVEPAFQNRGLGKILIAQAIISSKKYKIDLVGLIRADNYRSLRVFESFNSLNCVMHQVSTLWGKQYVPALSVGQQFSNSYDLHEERNRYDALACSVLADQNLYLADLPFGSSSVRPALRTPYLFFEERIRKQIPRNAAVFELGAGIGAFTLELARTGARVAAVDISKDSLLVLSKRLALQGYRVDTRVGDIVSLPAGDCEFDFVVSAGSLSYGDKGLVRQQILRVLKPGGFFICVDSLNDNPIYRVNRFIRYIRGERSKGTLVNMPSISLLREYNTTFTDVEIYYFGSISYLANPLAIFLGENITQRISDWIDQFVGVYRSAFKFVLIARKAEDGSRE